LSRTRNTAVTPTATQAASKGQYAAGYTAPYERTLPPTNDNGTATGQRRATRSVLRPSINQLA
jgi:hypothetical protein